MKCLGKSGLSRRDAGFYMARCSASRLSPKRPAFGPQPWLATGGAGPPPNPNNCRNLETRGTRPHTCRAVPPHLVIPADLDLRALARALATVVLAGAGALLGLWVLGDPGIAGVLTSTMKPNTSACLTALAASLLLHVRGSRTWARALAGFALAIGLGTLLEYGTGIDLHIDQLLARDAAQAEGPYAGRMAPNAAFGLAALGGALILFPGSGWRRRAAGWLALLVVFEAVLALLGYLHGTRSLYQVARALRLSQYTASGLLLLSIVAWPQGTALEVLVRRTAGGLLARRVLPPILTLPILLGFLRNAGERFGRLPGSAGGAGARRDHLGRQRPREGGDVPPPAAARRGGGGGGWGVEVPLAEADAQPRRPTATKKIPHITEAGPSMRSPLLKLAPRRCGAASSGAAPRDAGA